MTSERLAMILLSLLYLYLPSRCPQRVLPQSANSAETKRLQKLLDAMVLDDGDLLSLRWGQMVDDRGMGALEPASGTGLLLPDRAVNKVNGPAPDSSVS